MAQDIKDKTPPSVGLRDRILARIFPARFSTAEHTFSSKMLCVYSSTVSGFGIFILIVLPFSEGSIPMPRLGTVSLASMLFLVPILIRYFKSLNPISTYVVLVTTFLVFYVDFNNLSIQDFSGFLWLVPIMHTSIFWLAHGILYRPMYFFIPLEYLFT